MDAGPEGARGDGGGARARRLRRRDAIQGPSGAAAVGTALGVGAAVDAGA